MADRVFVHIGVPKSGTSYLQDRVRRNRELLESHGLHHPEGMGGDHFLAALDLLERRWAGEEERAKGQWEALTEAVRRSPGDVLISHEILAAATTEQVTRAFAGFGGAEVQVILTARDLARQIPAEWQEGVKHRRVYKFERFAGEVVEAPRISPELWFWRVQSIPDVLSRWSNGLRPDQVHVVTVPPSGAEPELLWTRFLRVLGIDPGLPFEPAGVDNASIGAAEIQMLRRLNRKLRRAKVSRETYVPLVRELIVREALAGRGHGPHPVLPREYRGFVEEVTLEWREWIEGSGVDVVGTLDDLEPMWTGTHAHPDRPRPADVADAAIDALAALLIDLDHKGEGSTWRSRLSRLRST
jgi:hypothetical protein